VWRAGPSRALDVGWAAPGSFSSARFVMVVAGGRTYIKGGRPTYVSTAGGLTQNQKACFVVAAILIGPAMLKQFYNKAQEEKVDLSQWNIVTKYDTPAIEKLDSTLRIEFCAS